MRRTGIELATGKVIAFDACLDPGEDAGVDRLRTGKAAKQASGQRGDEEQRGGGDDQAEGKDQGVLRPQDQVEDIELLPWNVEQYGLATAVGTIPVQPAQPIKDNLGEPYHDPARRIEAALHCFGVNFSLRAVACQPCFVGFAEWLVHVHFLLWRMDASRTLKRAG